MTKWRMLGSIFNSVNFSRNFITSGFSFLLFLSIVLYTDQFFNHVCYDVCRFYVELNTFNSVILNGRFKIVDDSRSFFDNN